MARTWESVDWKNPSDKVSSYFTVKEVLWAPQWNRIQNESDGLTDESKQALFKFFNETMDKVREYLGKPVHVHISYRSSAYNKLIGGANKSAHTARNDSQYGLIAACDFHADMGENSIGSNCDKIKKMMLPVLDAWKIRMEDNGEGATWIHLDNSKPGPSGRYFPPN